MPIIQSLLDTDLYKLTMMNAVYGQFGDVPGVEYEFRCRSGENLLPYKKEIEEEIRELCLLSFTKDELKYLSDLGFLSPNFLAYLSSFCLNKDYVFVEEIDGKLSIKIKGSWFRGILFEVPILAIVNEVYFRDVEPYPDYSAAISKLKNKIQLMKSAPGFNFAEFGTRRRCNKWWQGQVLGILSKELQETGIFIGTSNVYFAKKLGLKPVGTTAHEWEMAGQQLDGMATGQKYMLYKWLDEYKGKLGIALTDTIGIDAFLYDFDYTLANAYQGVRHDSGDPFVFADKIINHYEALGIDPKTKSIVFSDGLNTEKALKILDYVAGRIDVSFGIGTDITNDFPNIKPLSIVMKMQQCKSKPVAKISDEPEKAQCQDAVYLEELKKCFNVEKGGNA